MAVRYRRFTTLAASLLAGLAAACGGSDGSAPRASVGGGTAGNSATANGGGTTDPAPVSVTAAACGPGSRPETGLQGQVSLADRDDGRSQQGYSCNLELVGQYQGEGASWVDPFYRHCAYMATTLTGVGKKSPGVQVVDLHDPAHPKFAAALTSPSMLVGPWESLKVNERRGLLGGVAASPVIAGAFFEAYDLSKDCAAPVLQNGVGSVSVPANVLGHEGHWSPDGNTYWASGIGLGSLTAIDVANPKLPRIVYTGTGPMNHGFSFSNDGNRLYLALQMPAGVAILDVSDVQKRALVPAVRQLGSVTWNANTIGQMTIPVTWHGKPYLIATDEYDSVRILDISDETKPTIVNYLRLAIQLPENAAAAKADTAGTGLFAGYTSHYCTVDRRDDPTALACGFFNSGVRVFRLTGPTGVKEIAYYNPPAQTGKNDLLKGSEHANGIIGSTGYAAKLTADWCSSMPRFVGSDQLWVTCQDNGVQVLRFTNDVYRRATDSDDPDTETRAADD